MRTYPPTPNDPNYKENYYENSIVFESINFHMDENIEAEIAMPSEFKFVDGNYFESGDANIKFCYDSKNTQMKAFKVKGVTIARLSNEERINIPNAIDYIGYLTHVRRNIVVGKLYLFHVE